MPPRSDKTDEIVRLLNETDMSHRQIAAQVGCSRNAVSGVAMRNRSRVTRTPHASPKAKAKEAKPKKLGNTSHNFFLKAPKPINPPLAEPSNPELYAKRQARAIMQLKPRQCRFPLGEGDEFYFCWDSVMNPNCSYCAKHYRLTRNGE